MFPSPLFRICIIISFHLFSFIILSMFLEKIKEQKNLKGCHNLCHFSLKNAKLSSLGMKNYKEEKITRFQNEYTMSGSVISSTYLFIIS